MALTQEEFIQRSQEWHGDKYDYSAAIFRGVHKKVTIICPIHGEFEQFPHDHMRGAGCKKCGIDKIRGSIYSKAINDLQLSTSSLVYIRWTAILKRCCDNKFQSQNPSYIGCSICPEWYYLSNFKRWFDENYVEGCDIDKDILVKGNKIYSPDTCCFIPHRINTLLIRSKNRKKELPIGVYRARRGCRYEARYTDIINGFRINKHVGTYDTPEEAFQAYKAAKEAYIKEVAKEYYDRGDIPKCVYDALMRYEIEKY